jgi:hypothetical protein
MRRGSKANCPAGRNNEAAGDFSVPMRTRQTIKTIANAPASPTRFEATSGHSLKAKSESSCGSSALIQAAAALHEAANCIARLEARMQYLEASISHPGQRLLRMIIYRLSRGRHQQLTSKTAATLVRRLQRVGSTESRKLCVPGRAMKMDHCGRFG